MGFFTVLVASTILSACISVSLAIFAILRRSAPGVRAFSALMIANGLYAACYALELTSVELVRMLRVISFEYIGIASIPVLWLLFAWAYSGRHKSIGFPRVLLISIIPLISVVLVWTNKWHGLYYIRVGRRFEAPLPIFDFDPGLWYYINSAYQYLLFLIGLIDILSRALRTTAMIRSQAALVIAAATIPILANAFYLADLIPWGLDPIPVVFSISGLLCYLSLYHYKLFDLAPIARDHVVEAMRDGVIVLDHAGRIVDLNASANKILMAADAADVDDTTRLSLLPLPKQNGDPPMDFSLLVDNIPRRFRAVATAIPGGDSSIGTIITITDATETTMLLERLAKLATTDELTGADNRRRFMDSARRETDLARRGDRRLAVLMIDIDHFKAINDRHGHAVGDAVLKEVSRRCKVTLRSSDLFCRYGGEEFAALLPDADMDSALDVAERVRVNVRETPIVTDTASVRATISLGVAASDLGRWEDIESLLRRADEAMYTAKRDGRDRVRFSAP